jgi:hypothetical protein
MNNGNKVDGIASLMNMHESNFMIRTIQKSDLSHKIDVRSNLGIAFDCFVERWMYHEYRGYLLANLLLISPHNKSIGNVYKDTMYPSLVQKMRNLKTDLLFIAIPRH